MQRSQEWNPEVIVVGAGAAGLMAAISAARAGRRVLLLERTHEGGKKILISGGGRCNVLPSVSEPARFVTDSSHHSLRKILDSWPLAEQKRFFEKDAGIPLVLESATGKLFPASGRARQVRDRLVALGSQLGVRFRFDCLVTGLRPPGEGGKWKALLSRGDGLESPTVVLATGGLSVPSTGSDGTGLEVARSLGHTVRPTYPALTPLVADPPRHAGLAGVSLHVVLRASLGKREVVSRGGFLFTHRGYSGPAVLDLSHVATRPGIDCGARGSIHVQWTDRDEADWERIFRQEGGRVGSLLGRDLPDRLVRVLLSEAGVEPGRSLSQLRREDRRRIVNLLVRYPLPWGSHEGYRKAEVTGGGVALEELTRGTLESRIRPGLFLCGEILDAFGPIGGHNFQWAWATGRAAGLGAAKHCAEAESVPNSTREC